MDWKLKGRDTAYDTWGFMWRTAQIKKKVRNWEEGIKLASQPLLDDGFVNSLC